MINNQYYNKDRSKAKALLLSIVYFGKIFMDSMN
jgi:hypothetical protein